MEGKRLIDKEKVIKELEILRDICNAKSNMVIGNGKIAWAGYANSADDALSLLKAQEPIEPKVTKRKTGFGNVLSCWFDCGNCNKPIEHLKYRFCPYCGKGIKWDESEKND